jgi:hypothetical protein
MEEQAPLKRLDIGESGPATSTDLIAFVLAVPTELDNGATVAFDGSTVHPAADGDEAERAGLVPRELDEA